MTDNLVLKYIPVMTEEGKLEHFAEPDWDENEHDFLSTGNTREEQAFKQIIKDKAFNSELDIIMEEYVDHSKYVYFKEQLSLFLSKKLTYISTLQASYIPVDKRKLLRSLTKTQRALSNIEINACLRANLIDTLSEHLKEQNPDIDPFEAFCTASDTASFYENITVFMKAATKKTLKQSKTETVKKLPEKEAEIKGNIANTIAGALLKILNIKVKNTSETDAPELFDRLFILSCKTVGLEKVSEQSDHVKNAVKRINQFVGKKVAKTAT